jgi:hypothetical protein
MHVSNVKKITFHFFLESVEIEFLDINLAKELSLLLQTIHSPFYWRILMIIILFFWFKNAYKKIREARKLKSIHKQHFVERKNEGRKPDKNSSLKKLEFMPRNLD